MEKRKERAMIRKIILLALFLILCLVLLLYLLFGTGKKEKTPEENEEAAAQTEVQEEAPEEDPEESAEEPLEELRTAGTVEELAGETRGIDVARYQGTIDWKQAADSGLDFAMVRVGSRDMVTGEIREDSNARYNMQEADRYGIYLGVYFFSSAVTEEEAREEADWTAEYISRYSITYPVAYDCEGFTREESRQHEMSAEQRTAVAEAFLERIYEKGYTPMFYAAKNELTGNAAWDTARLEQKYRIWLAFYPQAVTGQPDYPGKYAMWQYTNSGRIPGIEEAVDQNRAYFGYAGKEPPHDPEAPEPAKPDAEALMTFTEVNETVTAKESTNLRDIPSQGETAKVICTLQNGDTAQRTGVSESGWSRVEYSGQTLYAVTNYLTTDLTPPVREPDDGLKTKFEAVSDSVTAKIEVNLRTLPSVTNPDSAVAAVLHNGEYVTRTGINRDYGWSRVEYNGQTLYCITSYLE